MVVKQRGAEGIMGKEWFRLATSGSELPDCSMRLSGPRPEFLETAPPLKIRRRTIIERAVADSARRALTGRSMPGMAANFLPPHPFPPRHIPSRQATCRTTPTSARYSNGWCPAGGVPVLTSDYVPVFSRYT